MVQAAETQTFIYALLNIRVYLADIFQIRDAELQILHRLSDSPSRNGHVRHRTRKNVAPLTDHSDLGQQWADDDCSAFLESHLLDKLVVNDKTL